MTRITYEITAVVENDLITEYEEFMTERHIPDLMATGAFASATLSRSSPGRYRIRYEARSREALDEYLANHARRLRNHLAGTFPAGIEFTREEWEVLAAFESAE
jgi:hypothetical protein